MIWEGGNRVLVQFFRLNQRGTGAEQNESNQLFAQISCNLFTLHYFNKLATSLCKEFEIERHFLHWKLDSKGFKYLRSYPSSIFIRIGESLNLTLVFYQSERKILTIGHYLELELGAYIIINQHSFFLANPVHGDGMPTKLLL